MRNLLFLAFGCLSGCVLIVTQKPGEFPPAPDVRITLTLNQALAVPVPPPAVEPPKVVVHQPLPVPPAVLVNPLPAQAGCPLFLLPIKATLPREVDFTDLQLKSKEDVEDALVAYAHALEKYIESERTKLGVAYRAYLIKCEALNIKN